ncbi:tRNA (adenosine(37)-N6)-threonylcarbamoyltransferase complex ATPase subunit type 1 TsaE [Asticcacaulis sp. AND118]|uniref:tRNA (adenosine(37)-N6)-threonylcarbamoyltransferase complex ATPase subunit type 1 TsaE n=1 Tax=Asticcacaulis sp. AND118 TaxID=2840468 RepID=UPI001CFFF7AC|nr:tRNA (adenosine(37)-N6)-threonylcarbamoyltransferase complex ATPase subunit type 1 TsaE [Asticcacaulis sp. AND118]UDF03529.1 tRNA (adenosine(37)-N6)-threonylcarbamoyltransferase complex ATPase subunit type 1 TsaE [Asticcacaulis sp. AND118]
MIFSDDCFLKDDGDTAAYGAWLAEQLSPGDVVYLLGELGAGKSTLARGLIRALTTPDEDVPSPTFTLVQTYEGRDFDIAHFDLYRLTDPEEVHEIGLFELADTHLCLIEWPQRLEGLRLGHFAFDAPWIVRLKEEDSGRRVTLERPGQ